MDRRKFLVLLGSVAAAPAVSYFLPPIGGWRRTEGGMVFHRDTAIMHVGESILPRNIAEKFQFGTGTLYVDGKMIGVLQNISFQLKKKLLDVYCAGEYGRK